LRKAAMRLKHNEHHRITSSTKWVSRFVRRSKNSETGKTVEPEGRDARAKREARAPKGLEGPVDRRSTAKSLIKLEKSSLKSETVSASSTHISADGLKPAGLIRVCPSTALRNTPLRCVARCNHTFQNGCAGLQHSKPIITRGIPRPLACLSTLLLCFVPSFPANQYRSVCRYGTTVDYRKTVSGPAATESPSLRTCELMDRGLLLSLLGKYWNAFLRRRLIRTRPDCASHLCCCTLYPHRSSVPQNVGHLCPIPALCFKEAIQV